MAKQARKRKRPTSPLAQLILDHSVYTQAALAEWVGYSIWTWRHIVCGSRRLPDGKVALLAQLLSVSEAAVRKAAEATYKEG